MSWLKAAAQGFSGAGAQVANKYLDEQLAQQRAEFMAQLQRRTAGEIRADDFAFKTDPTRVQTTRDIAAGDVAAQGKAKRDAQLAEWNDPIYQSARDAQTDKETKAEAKRQSLMAEARARAEARFRPAQPGSDDPFAKLPPAVRAAYQGLSKQAEQINAAIVKAQADGMWEPDKNPSQADLQVRLMALQDRANDLLTPYIPKQGGGAGSPDDDIRRLLMGEGAAAAPAAGGAGPAGTPKPAAEQPVDPQREAMSLRQRAQTNTRAAAQGINSAAQQALRARDPVAAQEVMDSPSFNLLDQATKTAVRNLVFGK